ncbi:MAG: cytochrome c peroxidase [Planctomycetales bacterium]
MRSMPLVASLLVAFALFAAGCSESQPTPEVTPLPPPLKTTETKPAETKAEESKPAEPKPAEPKTTDTKATVATPVKDAKPVMLGTDELTLGVPGKGKLTLEQVNAWLADPKNHAPLQIELPLGLNLGQSAIKGLDKNPLTRAKIELGRQLYFDKRLSVDSTVSCADCHHPDNGWAKETQFGVGVKGQQGGRNSPVSFNRILTDTQFWDGRAASLEEQAVGPIANPIEMGNTHDAVVAMLKKNPVYVAEFTKVFPDGVTIGNVGKALASFERTVVTGPAPADYYEPLRALENAFKDDLKDPENFKKEDPESYEQYVKTKAAADAHPMSESAKRGREIFYTQKGGCTACHVGANFSDEKYHNLGVGMEKKEPDLGRFAITHDLKDKGAFKTPTIRNVEQTAPYMHDGSQKTLEEVVEWYNKGGHPNPQLDKDIKKLNLTDQEKKDLVAFMKACTGPFPKVEMSRLPE